MTDAERLVYTRSDEKEVFQVVQDYHLVMYTSGVWKNMTYLGVPILKNPLDLWIYQEIISETKPDVIIETGTYEGGSALYLAGILDALGHGNLISIDIEPKGTPKHPRVEYLVGSSVDPRMADYVKFKSEGLKVLVILDSAHNKSHVLKEMELYGPLVTPGQYLIVEDTNLNGHPVPFHATDEEHEGPFEAVQEYLKSHSTKWVNDVNRGKFGVTFNPSGFLKRVNN